MNKLYSFSVTIVALATLVCSDACAFEISAYYDPISIVQLEGQGASGLHPSYPNPFNGRTTLRFSLTAESEVDARVFDVTGREAMRVLHGRLNAGEQTVELNASALASGVYLLVLRAGAENFCEKLLLIR